MASKTISDLGPGRARYDIDRDGPSTRVRVTFLLDDGTEGSAELTRAEVIDATTAADRTATLATLAKLHAAALAKSDFT